MKLVNILYEYSDKTINNTIERWKKENSKLDDKIAKQLIQRFDQIKGSIKNKLDIVSLSDDLRKNNNYLNIDKYSLDDMIKLIKSLPENPDKIKKDAIQNFVNKEYVDKNTAQSYVARFLNKKNELKYAFENGTEDGQFEKKDVQNLIPKYLHNNNAYLDPRNWKWEAFEQMLDALFPSQKEIGDEDNNATTDADKIYDKDGIEIYKGDDVNKCISYNPTQDKKKKYGWCVAQPGNTNYDGYRFGDRGPTFYFVFDRSKPSVGSSSMYGGGKFEDKWHAFVIQVNADGKSYVVTSANNDADNKASSWNEISKIVPPDTWNKIKDLEKYFKPIPLSAVERGRKFASGRNLTLDEFKDLNQDEKILYVQGKASKNGLSKEILDILPKYKISYEGRSTTLANIAIDNGQKFQYSALKDYEPLAKRYAVFRFRHTDYSKDPIPLPYIKFLDDDAKKKYLKQFEDNLNENLVKKYFGEDVFVDYINEKAKNLDYISEPNIKYIKDSKLRDIFDICSKLYENWVVEFDDSDESLENKFDNPNQPVYPKPIFSDEFKKLSSSDLDTIVKLAKETEGNEKYTALYYGLPYILKDGGDYLFLVPKRSNEDYYSNWVILDKNKKELKSINTENDDVSLEDNSLLMGYPSDGKYTRIYSISDLKKEGKPISLKESYYEDWNKYLLQKRAGIIK